MKRAHMHHYEIHPNPEWVATHVYCVTCGFAVHKSMLEIAIEKGATASADGN
jgi:hypothetical protein